MTSEEFYIKFCLIYFYDFELYLFEKLKLKELNGALINKLLHLKFNQQQFI